MGDSTSRKALRERYKRAIDAYDCAVELKAKEAVRARCRIRIDDLQGVIEEQYGFPIDWPVADRRIRAELAQERREHEANPNRQEAWLGHV